MIRRVIVELVVPLSQVVHFIMRRVVGVREIYGRHVGILRTPGVESRVETFVALGLVLLAFFALEAVVLLPPALPEVVVDIGLVLLYLSVRSGNESVWETYVFWPYAAGELLALEIQASRNGCLSFQVRQHPFEHRHCLL